MPGCLSFDLNHQEVLCNHKRTLVCCANGICHSLFVLVMINDGEFRLHSREHAPGVFSRCKRSQGLWSGVLGTCQPGNMNQAVRTLRELDKVLRELGIARDDHCMT